MVTVSELTQDAALTGIERFLVDDGLNGTTKQVVLSETTLTAAASLTLMIAQYLVSIGVTSLKLGDGTSLSTANILDTAVQFTDNTTNNATTTKHGFFPKLPTPAGLYLKDNMSWSTPSGAGDVTGPASAIGDNIVLFDLVSGKLIKDSGINLSTKANLVSPMFTTPNIGAATGTSIASTGSFDILLDTDNNGTEYLNVKNGAGTTIVQITESGYIIGNGYLQMAGGVAINTSMFNVDGANGNTDIAGTLIVNGPYFYSTPNFRQFEETTGGITELVYQQQKGTGNWVEYKREADYGGVAE